jgi:hypothetical protein
MVRFGDSAKSLLTAALSTLSLAREFPAPGIARMDRVTRRDEPACVLLPGGSATCFRCPLICTLAHHDQ